MDDKSKAEKRAAGRLLLQKYQKKTKDGKSSPSPKNNPQQNSSGTSEEYSFDNESREGELMKNGHSEGLTHGSQETKDTVGYFTFSKDHSPTEQFFDSFRPSPQLSFPDHCERYDMNVQDVSSSIYDVCSTSDHLKDNDCSLSSRSSRSDEIALKRLIESQLGNDIPLKEEVEKKLIESNEKVAFFENENKKLKEEIFKLRSQQMPLEENVQLHLKTIEILVSEKSELQQHLSKTREEQSINRNTIADLSARLKASEEQVRNLTKDLSEVYEAREQHNTILKKLEHSLVEANQTSDLHRKEVIDAMEEINFLKKKIEQMSNQTQDMKKQLDEKDKQLSMAEMKLAQLGGGSIPTKADITKVENLEKECARIKEELSKVIKEKSDVVSQYQQYIETLNSQIQLINQQYESCLVSKNQLLIREESLVKHISELEKKVQKDHQAGPSLSETNNRLNQELKEVNTKVTELSTLLNEKDVEILRLNAALDESTSRLSEVELSLERLEVPDARKLQAAMENDRVAATRAVQQNTQLKQHVAELQEAVVRLSNEKLELTEKWQHSEHVSSELTRDLKKFKGKQEVEVRDAVAQCTVVFYTDNGCQASIDEVDIPTTMEHITPEAIGLLENKLKKTMNDYANLYDEKQRLEHLVLHLQSETETIGEYVTLYQNQRSLLQERAMERDRQMAAVAKEREELRLKLAEISSLLPQVMQDPRGEPETNPSTELNGVADQAPASKIKTLLTEIETSSLVKDLNQGIQSNFHPCLLCSGKLITI